MEAATARNTSSNHLRLQKADAPSFRSKQSSHQTKRNNQKLPPTGFKQQPICTPLAPKETKSSTKQLALTDPILGPENLLKTGFAQKGLPSIPHGVRRSDFPRLPPPPTFSVSLPLWLCPLHLGATSFLLPLAAVVWGLFCLGGVLLLVAPPFFWIACPFLVRSDLGHALSAVLCPLCGFSIPFGLHRLGSCGRPTAFETYLGQRPGRRP